MFVFLYTSIAGQKYARTYCTCQVERVKTVSGNCLYHREAPGSWDVAIDYVRHAEVSQKVLQKLSRKLKCCQGLLLQTK